MLQHKRSENSFFSFSDQVKQLKSLAIFLSYSNFWNIKIYMRKNVISNFGTCYSKHLLLKMEIFQKLLWVNSWLLLLHCSRYIFLCHVSVRSWILPHIWIHRPIPEHRTLDVSHYPSERPQILSECLKFGERGYTLFFYLVVKQYNSEKKSIKE